MPKGVYQRKPRPAKTYPEELVSQVKRLYGQGMTQSQLAIALGLTQKIVWRLMKHHGIKSRAPVQRVPVRGAFHAHWKGNKASYKAFHMRLYALRGAPMLCDVCRTTDPQRRYDWANMTGRYEDPDDYARLCRQCHRQYDDKRRGKAPNEGQDVTPIVVCALRSQGLSINEIARRLGTSWPTVRKHIPE